MPSYNKDQAPIRGKRDQDRRVRIRTDKLIAQQKKLAMAERRRVHGGVVLPPITSIAGAVRTFIRGAGNVTRRMPPVRGNSNTGKLGLDRISGEIARPVAGAVGPRRAPPQGKPSTGPRPVVRRPKVASRAR